MVAACIDRDGVAVITGGAAGFGREVALRLVREGMSVALLDVSQKELDSTSAELSAEGKAGKVKVLPVLCNVTDFQQCAAAAQKVKEAFPDRKISFLFNNAGIAGQESAMILQGSPQTWPSVFSVNVFGAVNIIKAFLPGMIEAGPLKSGKKTILTTTSSVVGLLHHNPSPYSVSKFACTAMCEQLALELEGMGEKAAHISPHILMPTVCGTGFLNCREPDGKKALDDRLKTSLLKAGGFGASEIAEGLFAGLDAGQFYVIVDHPLDIPSIDQVKLRLEDQMKQQRPRMPDNLAMMLNMKDPPSFRRRKDEAARVGGSFRSRIDLSKL
mmetsp:Transcript_81044/g.177958  ORF Transcript_81044/g.177958 Transcript_81044/m.177958 type:complete len:328 (+) Transcript_81044:66-1049(+)